MPNEMFRHLVRAFGVAAHFMRRGRMLLKQQRPADAIVWMDRALEYDPWNAEIFYQRGNARMALADFAAAAADYTQALNAKSDFADAAFNCGLALQRLRRFDEALDRYDRALSIKPGDAEALNNRGNVLQELQRNEEALAAYEQALAVRPYYVEALYNRAVLLMLLRRTADGVAAYRNLLAIAPDYPYAEGRLLQASMICCDWSRYGELTAAVETGIAGGRRSIEPFAYLAVVSSPESQRRCAEIYGADFAALPLPPVPRRAGGGRIRIGYIAGEFRHHATGFLMAGLFEMHDKSRFELIAFDKAGDDGSAVRARINRAFEAIVDIRGRNDDEIAAMVRDRGIDLLVDLNGFVGVAHPGVCARRPAPLQINYLGAPGTMGMDGYDYIIADRVVIPPGDEVHYSEKVVRLPDSYQVNDAQRRIDENTPDRAACGLPADAFVFCCFNNNYKITPPVFAVWMRLLAKIDRSVLWLLEDNAEAAANLRREAAVRGIDPQRLVFAARTDLDRHLARQRCADLFLDTLPCNAHTTASDALWAGLPLLTCAGNTFTGRVAASLLAAVGMPELVAGSIAEYEARARELASSPEKLAEIRRRLKQNRLGCALFDTARYCSNLESAYTTMWQRHLRGESPQGFSV